MNSNEEKEGWRTKLKSNKVKTPHLFLLFKLSHSFATKNEAWISRKSM